MTRFISTDLALGPRRLPMRIHLFGPMMMVHAMLGVLACVPPTIPDSGPDDAGALDVAAGDHTLPDRAGTDGGAFDQTPVNDAGGDDVQLPIVERPSSDTYSCEELHQALQIPDLNMWWGASALFHQGNHYVARGEGSYGNMEIQLARVGLDGTVLGDSVVSSAALDWAWEPSMVAAGNELALVWVEMGDSEHVVRFARVDLDGQILSGPTEIASSRGPDIRYSRLQPSPDGFALLWRKADGINASLMFLHLDSNGAELGSVQTAADGQTMDRPFFRATGSGYGLMWEGFNDESNRDIRFLRLLGSGAPQGDPSVLSDPHRRNGDPGFIETASGYIVTWSEMDTGTDPMSNNQGTIILAQLDATGTMVGRRQILHAPEMDHHSWQPRLVTVGDSIAVVWSHGVIHYVCAGCMPDNSLHFMLLDPGDLNPRSNPVEIVPRGSSGGLLDPVVSHDGLDFLFFTNITYHVSSVPASAAARCTAR